MLVLLRKIRKGTVYSLLPTVVYVRSEIVHVTDLFRIVFLIFAGHLCLKCLILPQLSQASDLFYGFVGLQILTSHWLFEFFREGILAYVVAILVFPFVKCSIFSSNGHGCVCLCFRKIRICLCHGSPSRCPTRQSGRQFHPVSQHRG